MSNSRVEMKSSAGIIAGSSSQSCTTEHRENQLQTLAISREPSMVQRYSLRKVSIHPLNKDHQRIPSQDIKDKRVSLLKTAEEQISHVLT